MSILKINLPADLTTYLQHRALRAGRTVQQELEMMIRESQTYDGLVTKMWKDTAISVEPSNN